MLERADTTYSQAPLMVYWELTRACDLACRHCRAEAVAWRHPDELSTAEGYRLLDRLAGFGDLTPHLVFTGGDPLKRPDVYALAAHAVEAGLPVAITPSGTPLLTQEAIARLYAAGVRTMGLSLDGSTSARHDRIRGVAGSFKRTLAAARWARAAGFSLQINSLVCAETAADLADVYQRVLDLDADRWGVFFLVAVGRGAVLNQVDAYAAEAILEWLYELTLESPRPIIKTTEAHHFRRIALQQQKQAAKVRPTNGHAAGERGGWRRLLQPRGRSARAAGAADSSGTASATSATSSAGGPPAGAAAVRRGFGIRDGAGIMFISHTGEVYPAGFLPLSAGNIRVDDPVRLYREAPLFRRLRDPSQLKGKCSACEFKTICGGSRSRAWAATGDPLEADPLCAYQPAAHTHAASA